MTMDERLEGPLSLAPEMSSLNMGSMNFGLFPALDRFSDWKHDWEPVSLENTRGGIFRNTFSDIEAILDRTRKADFPVRTLIHEVVQSSLFRNKCQPIVA